MPDLHEELTALAAYLGERREAILQAWRLAVKVDPGLTTGDALPRAQLNDHIPAVLANFERELGGAAGDSGMPAAADRRNEDAAAHGLHRWQQGYDLREVTRELGRLNECMVVELEAYAVSRAHPDPSVMATARRMWATSCSVGIEESTAQYFRLQQTEALGHVQDLERALEDVRELERHRSDLWQQVAHDLRGNVGIVANATRGLTRSNVPETTRERFLHMLDRNVHALHQLLDDVTGLARLNAGRERRQIAKVDVGTLLRELCDGLQPMAQQRRLALHVEGPVPFVVEADAAKTRRLAQNLVLNALKYTVQGSVSVAWGDSDSGDGKRWALSVRDTGPGFHAGPGAPLAGAIEDATRLPNLVTGTDGAGSSASPTLAAAAPPSDPRPVQQEPGEGIGLSIVKRLCELLDSTIELASAPGQGTTFRILLPREYSAAPPVGPAATPAP